jgi:hypothetical protein
MQKVKGSVVLYCGRHDFGTDLLRRTGNLALVMRIMRQKSLKAAMAYQHPELEQVRLVLKSLAGPAWLEHATLCFEGRCSIHLSYGPNLIE